MGNQIPGEDRRVQFGELGIEFQPFEAKIHIIFERLQIVENNRILIHLEPVFDQDYGFFFFGVPFEADFDGAIVISLRHRMGVEGTVSKKEQNCEQKRFAQKHTVRFILETFARSLTDFSYFGLQ
jgi:hypothetical protein